MNKKNEKKNSYWFPLSSREVITQSPDVSSAGTYQFHDKKPSSSKQGKNKRVWQNEIQVQSRYSIQKRKEGDPYHQPRLIRAAAWTELNGFLNQKLSVSSPRLYPALSSLILGFTLASHKKERKDLDFPPQSKAAAAAAAGVAAGGGTRVRRGESNEEWEEEWADNGNAGHELEPVQGLGVLPDNRTFSRHQHTPHFSWLLRLVSLHLFSYPFQQQKKTEKQKEKHCQGRSQGSPGRSGLFTFLWLGSSSSKTTIKLLRHYNINLDSILEETVNKVQLGVVIFVFFLCWNCIWKIIYSFFFFTTVFYSFSHHKL